MGAKMIDKSLNLPSFYRVRQFPRPSATGAQVYRVPTPIPVPVRDSVIGLFGTVLLPFPFPYSAHITYLQAVPNHRGLP
jgi:hypothetical protein